MCRDLHFTWSLLAALQKQVLREGGREERAGCVLPWPLPIVSSQHLPWCHVRVPCFLLLIHSHTHAHARSPNSSHT